MRPSLAAAILVATALAGPVSAQSLLGSVVGTVGDVVTTVTDTAGDVTGTITGGSETSSTSPSQASQVRRGGSLANPGALTRGAGCQRVRFNGLPGGQFDVDRVQIRKLSVCVEPHVQSIAMVRQVPGVVSELEAKGYDLSDLVTFEAKDDGLLLLYVYERN